MKKAYSVFTLMFLSVITFAQLPQYYNFNTTGSNNSFPMGISTGKMLQALVVAGEFNQPTPAPSGVITKFSMRVNDQYPYNNVTYSFIYIRMGQAAITTLPTGAFYTGTMDTVFKATSYLINAAGGTWITFNLTTPFTYNNAQALIIEIGQFGFSGSNFYPACNTTLTGNRRSYSVGGPPFVYSGQGAQMMACGIEVAPLTPAYYNFNTIAGTNTYPFNQFPGQMVQWLYVPGDFNQPSNAPSGNITAVYYFFGGSGATNRQFVNFTIRMKRTGITTLPGSLFGPMDTVYHRDTVLLSSSTGAWTMIPLDVPYMYRNDSSLVMDVGHCGYSPTSGQMWICQTSRTGFRRNYCPPSGCPFVYQGQDATQAHFGIYIPNPVGIQNNNNNQVPDAFRLDQNYPNPFNPVTTISFGLPKSSNVKLTIYDMLGREVAVLVNEFVQAGNHAIDFDASDLASGTYLYKIEAGSFIETKKMMLVK